MKNNRQCVSLWAAALVALNACTTHGATILEGLTSVDTLDYTNVVAAWNFVDANSPVLPGSDLVVQGVTFTTASAGNGTYGNLAVGGLLGATSGFEAFQTIASGGTATDRANLRDIFGSIMNGQQGTSAGNDITLDVSGLSSGTYKIQYLWAANGATDRQFSITAEGSTPTQWVRTSSTTLNYLFTEQVDVTDGTLNIRVIAETADLDERRFISGLIVSQIPEPSTALLGGLGALLLLRRRRHA